MIGVIANPAEHEVVREFFELFKTPWEFYRRDQKYDVVLCAGDEQVEGTSKLLVVYGGRKFHFDDEQRVTASGPAKDARVFTYRGARIPIYGGSATFSGSGSDLLRDEETQECAAYVDRSNEGVLVRIGYDLFREVQTLLTVGQPPANAGRPALELHISVLRDLITGCGVSLVEIPPVPEGYGFIACLTHDVDHPSIRQHKWDHTVFGFLYRAIFGSLRDFTGGQMPIQDLLANWAAVLKLPFIYVGLVKDFWRGFDDRYLELETGLHSTFFVIPFRNRRGKTSEGQAPRRRAASYGAHELAEVIQKLMNAGCEVGLHGIDAWVDSSEGCEELNEIRRLTGVSEIGVRMHWLYFDQQSPATLETAGVAYDSTVGYNETVGYRAGTTQVYKLLRTSRLLELPLHAMDTALFYPSYLDLSPREAKKLLGKMVDDVAQFGGALTINWHDRSLAPERLWGECYCDLIQDLKSRGAWFATAGQATSWFRKRRAAAFETDSSQAGAARVKVPVNHGDNLPSLRLRHHKAGKQGGFTARSSEGYIDMAIEESFGASVPSEVRR